MTSSSRGSRLGTRFGPYELRSLIGTGAMGEVYRAYDTVKDRMVALKLLRGETAADPGFQQRLWRECRKVTRLQEPHVLPLHDFGEIDGVPFIDMHLVDDGGSLKDLLREQGGLEPSRAASITAQVARALDAAHAGGLVHLDVKPENILLTHDHFTYLADFGIAQAVGDDKDLADLHGARAIHHRTRRPQTDVYSLACVLYECLTGQPPFESEDAGELKRAHMLAPAPRPSIMRRGVGREYDDIITRGMAKQGAARFASAGELARAASEAVFAAYEPVGAAAGQSVPSKTRPLPTVSLAELDEPADSSPEPPAAPGALVALAGDRSHTGRGGRGGGGRVDRRAGVVGESGWWNHRNGSAPRRVFVGSGGTSGPDDLGATADADAVASGEGRRRVGFRGRDGPLRSGQSAGSRGANRQVIGGGV